MPNGPNLPLYRRFAFGNLAKFHVLDTRQYRDDLKNLENGVQNPERTILGDEQEDWLVSGLQDSDSAWNVLANQILMASIGVKPDWWDGYPADRKTLLEVMAQDSDLNPIVITGDIHRNYAYDLKADFSNPDSETVGTEYVGTSITSFGDGSGFTQYGPSARKSWQRLFNDERGYVRCTITPDRYRADYRVVSTVEKPTASVRTLTSYATESGNPGAKLVSEPPEQEPIEITTISRDASGPESEDSNVESLRLKNTGNTTVDLSGFMLSFQSLLFRVPASETGEIYTFDDYSLGAGETVTVRNRTGEDTQSTLYTGNEGHPARAAFIANSDGLLLDEEVYPSESTNSKTVQTETDRNAVTENTDNRTTATALTGNGSTDRTTARVLPTETTARVQATSEGDDVAITDDERANESGSTGPGFGILAAALAGLVGVVLQYIRNR